MKTSPKIWASLGALVLAAIGAIVSIEGGYVNDPRDPGGATNFGVTEQVARANGYTGPMRALPREFAEDVYAQKYIRQPKFDQVLAVSPAVGYKLTDAGVNTGPSRGARWYQQAINDLSRGGRDYPRIAVDGRIGPGTIAAYQALERKRGRVKACELVIKLMDARQAMHYVTLSMQTFTVGWIDHRIGNVPLSRCSERVAA